MISLTKGEFTRIIEDPYPPNAPRSYWIGIDELFTQMKNKVIRKDKFEEM